MEERKVVIDKSMNEWNNLMQGKEFNQKVMGEFYHHLAMDVAREKKRIGGDFVIANILMTAELREHLRSWLGPDLRIVLLSMTKEDRRERTLARHKGHQTSADTLDLFGSLIEGMEGKEPNTVEIKVTNSMSKQEVVDKILQEIEAIN